jgi:hypothetical protein
LRDAAGELNQGFLAGNAIQDFANSFDGGELSVGIEDVELRIVGDERRSGVFGDGCFAVGGRGRFGQRGQRGFVAGNEGVHGLLQQFTVVCEIRNHLQRVAEFHDAHQIRRRHLLRRYFCAARVERSKSSG